MLTRLTASLPKNAMWEAEREKVRNRRAAAMRRPTARARRRLESYPGDPHKTATPPLEGGTMRGCGAMASAAASRRLQLLLDPFGQALDVDGLGQERDAGLALQEVGELGLG